MVLIDLGLMVLAATLAQEFRETAQAPSVAFTCRCRSAAFDSEHFEKASDMGVLRHPGHFEKAPVLPGQAMRGAQNAHVESFLEMLVVERSVSENTRITYYCVLRAFAGFLVSRSREIEDAQAEDIQAYLEDLAAAGRASSTIGQRLSTLRQFYRFPFAAGLRADDPVAALDGPYACLTAAR